MAMLILALHVVQKEFLLFVSAHLSHGRAGQPRSIQGQVRQQPAFHEVNQMPRHAGANHMPSCHEDNRRAVTAGGHQLVPQKADCGIGIFGDRGIERQLVRDRHVMHALGEGLLAVEQDLVAQLRDEAVLVDRVGLDLAVDGRSLTWHRYSPPFLAP